MKIYTYFEPMPSMLPGEEDLLSYCTASWKRNGFDIAVLTEDHAKAHPLYGVIHKNKDLVVNSGSRECWEWHSYNRWLALLVALNDRGVRTGGLIDYDMINYGFKPDHLLDIIDLFILRRGALAVNLHAAGGFAFDKDGTLRPPTPVWGFVDHFNYLLAAFRGFVWQGLKEGPYLRRCASDQAIIHDRELIEDVDFPSPAPCVMFKAKGWQEAPIVHYTHYSVSGRVRSGRMDTIKQVEVLRGRS